jgi:predicted secreted protein
MNKRNSIIAGLTSCLLLGGSLNIFAYAADNNSKADTQKPSPIFTAAEKGKAKLVLSQENVLKTETINKVKLNQNFYVILSENASTGYTWSYKTNNTAIQLIDQKNILQSDKKLVGAPSQKVWTFKAVQKGTYKLQFSYSRSWEKNTPPAKTVDYTIEVSDNSSNKKITKETSITHMPAIKTSVTWNGITYKVYVPTYGVNDKIKKDYDYIQSRIGKHLGSDFYEIKGIDIKKSIAYKVWKYYYKCDAMTKK